ncbi:2-(1,2-epoxy-1,2-dihydrophenyl)acetyl-CoA isomerase PaaG [Oceanibacterium hippocampi]|uniref:1,2-epoxyphenylacetyl-CoA isomerase n=1 Tax=Oceanibacterium hippocampi TaxID=745714 RepID=A0A1Y5TZ97_9PROT|nr:2-(1,2-epoxy-1,2-dihydrophenyl)acetyl-CoA isomerase PaaG [Oceanibacterium hippocampi]SLN77419.1 1,2-epoxyphenylacetyl-CoA isomerase [Oceanibacterium hippocampi]
MGFESIEFTTENQAATIRLNRPDRLNSFTDGMHGELRQALDAVAADDTIRCLLITGAGRAFCAGADLTQTGPASDGEGGMDIGLTLERHYNPLIKGLRELPKPVVAAVNGPAAGAGMSLAMAADVVVAARSAYFLQAFCNIGLVPDAGSTFFLPRLAGSARAAGMALLGEKLPAEEAERWGLIWKCVDDDKLGETAAALVAKLANGPTRGLGMIKRALNASLGNDLDQQLGLERVLQRDAGRTADFAEGVTAFLGKRPATFKGK